MVYLKLISSENRIFIFYKYSTVLITALDLLVLHFNDLTQLVLVSYYRPVSPYPGTKYKLNLKVMALSSLTECYHFDHFAIRRPKFQFHPEDCYFRQRPIATMLPRYIRYT